jgi:hypothetical protein
LSGGGSRQSGPATLSGPRSETRPRCFVVRLRASVHERRLATWRWLDRLDIPRTATSYAERRTHGCAYLRWLKALWSARADATWRLFAELRDNPRKAICHVFGRYCREALAVSWCEAKWNPRAHNGQYLGAFQMGSSERRLYGHGETVLEQARAALRYFLASGRDWSPWSCRP